MFFPTFVGNLEDIYNNTIINCNKKKSQPCVDNLSFNLINVKKLHQPFMAWFFPS